VKGAAFPRKRRPFRCAVPGSGRYPAHDPRPADMSGALTEMLLGGLVTVGPAAEAEGTSEDSSGHVPGAEGVTATTSSLNRGPTLVVHTARDATTWVDCPGAGRL